MAKKLYTVRYERAGDGWWVASVSDVHGCHTQGKSIAQARKRIRKALALSLHISDKAADALKLIDNLQLPTKLAEAVEAHEAAVEAAQKHAAELQDKRAKAAKALAAEGLSVRDVGEVLGISFQRVQQLVS